MKEQLRFLQTLLNSITSPIFYKDAVGTYIGCNKAFEQYIGKTTTEIIGKTVYELAPFDLAQRYHQMDVSLLESGGSQVYEASVVYADGVRHDVIFNKSVYYDQDGTKAGIVGVILDISERKQLENACQRMQDDLKTQVEKRTLELQQSNIELQYRNAELKAMAATLVTSEEKFSKDFYYCSEVVGIVRLSDRKFIEINDAFSRIFGYHKEEVIGHSSIELKLWADSAHGTAIYRTMLKNEKFQNLESIWRTKNGELRTGIHSSEIIELSGERCALFVWHDITERKRAEEALQQANIELESKVADRTVELTQKIQELRQAQEQLILHEKLAGIGQLAAGVAHEMNNPLGFVISNFQVLEKHADYVKNVISQYQVIHELLEKGDWISLKNNISNLLPSIKKSELDFITTDMQEICQESKDGLKRVADIVKALRSFSRYDISAGAEEYDLNEGIKTTLLIARNEIKAVANVECDLGDIPHIAAIGGQINQVLLNILINAAHAIGAANMGGNGKISIRTHCTERYVCCSITNNGPPIPEEFKSKIFEPFFTTKPVGKGTGIGLSLSYDIIVNRHKGQFFFVSTEEEGTTFSIELPV